MLCVCESITLLPPTLLLHPRIPLLYYPPIHILATPSSLPNPLLTYFPPYLPLLLFPQVVFSLYVDKKTNKRIAKNVRLTDETIPGMNGDQTGILDVVVLRCDTSVCFFSCILCLIVSS